MSEFTMAAIQAAPVHFDRDGGSCIIDPRGEVIAGPEKGSEMILIANAKDAAPAVDWRHGPAGKTPSHSLCGL